MNQIIQSGEWCDVSMCVSTYQNSIRMSYDYDFLFWMCKK